MTKSNWRPSSWLAIVLTSVLYFQWENVQPDDVEIKMPDLVQHLKDLATENASRTRGAISRDYTSESRPETNRLAQSPDSTQRKAGQTRPNF
jgi:hypothetical protein